VKLKFVCFLEMAVHIFHVGVEGSLYSASNRSDYKYSNIHEYSIHIYEFMDIVGIVESWYGFFLFCYFFKKTCVRRI